MGQIRLEPVTRDHIIPPIDCGHDDIQAMMSEAFIMTLQKQGTAYNVLLNQRIVGQCMLRMYTINDEDYESTYSGHEFACIKIQYLCIDVGYQNKGIGTLAQLMILKKTREIIKNLPIRFIYIEAVQNREEWFKKFAFSRIPEGVTLANPHNTEVTVPMCIDCMDHIAVQDYNDWMIGD